MKFLRGVPVVDKFDEKNLSYQGLSGQKYTLDFFLSAGLQMSTLRKVIQDSDFKSQNTYRQKTIVASDHR